MSTDDEQRQQAALREYARSLSDEQWNLFSAQVRPPERTDPARARQSIAAKSAQLLSLPRDENGIVGGFAATVAARQPRTPAQPEQPPTQGFTANRPQHASGDANPPAPAQQSDWSNKPRIYPPGGAF